MLSRYYPLMGQEHVLLASPRNGARRRLATMLDRLGYRVLEAECAALAVRLIEENDDVSLVYAAAQFDRAMDGDALLDWCCNVRPSLHTVLHVGSYLEAAFCQHHHGRLIIGPQPPSAILATMRELFDGELPLSAWEIAARDGTAVPGSLSL